MKPDEVWKILKDNENARKFAWCRRHRGALANRTTESTWLLCADVCSLAPVRKVPKRMTRPDHGDTGEGSSVSLCLKNFQRAIRKAVWVWESLSTYSLCQMLERCLNSVLTFRWQLKLRTRVDLDAAVSGTNSSSKLNLPCHGAFAGAGLLRRQHQDKPTNPSRNCTGSSVSILNKPALKSIRPFGGADYPVPSRLESFWCARPHINVTAESFRVVRWCQVNSITWTFIQIKSRPSGAKCSQTVRALMSPVNCLWNSTSMIHVFGPVKCQHDVPISVHSNGEP